MSNVVTVFYDCVSPWSYVAFTVLKRYRSAWGIKINLCPMSLSYIMKYANNRPPVTVPNKGKLLMSELRRADRMHGVHLMPPETFPFETFLAQQFLTVLKDKFPEDLEMVTERFFEHIWGKGKPLATAEEVVSVASTVLPQEKLAQLAGFHEKDVRKRLAMLGQSLAEDHGVFGSPWLVAERWDGESIVLFGSDRFEHLAAFFHKPYLGPFANGVTPKL